MAKTRLDTFLLSLILAVSTFFGVGKSDWIIPGEANVDNITINNGSRAVCYNGRTKTKYTTIEKALEVAKNDTANNDTIYVIPGTNPVITRSCEIASGDTLCLPYDGETYKVDINGLKGDDSSFKNYHSDKFADSQETAYLKSNVTIEGVSETKKTTLTVNGTLLVGGILGVGEGNYQKPSGHTVNNYAQITMKGCSSIVNKGTIECRGYIKPFDEKTINECNLLNESGSVVTVPFVLYDYRGGSYSSACNNENVFPFSIFDMPNCHINSTYNYGSTLKVLIHAYANDKVYSPNPTVLLSKDNGLFKLESGSVSFRYDPSTFNKTTNDANTGTKENGVNKLIVSINGSITLDSMTISLAGNSLKTSNFYVPFSYKFDISINSGTVLNIINKVKFLSGSNLRIEEGATVNMDASTTFYQRYDGHNTLADVYPNSLGSAKLINNGILNLNSSFGGKIDTSTENSVIKTGDNFSSQVTSREVLTGSSLGTKRTYFDITTYGYCNFCKADNSSTIDAQLNKSNTYTSVKFDSKYSWVGEIGSTTITEVHGASQNVNGCFAKGTKIMMGDGTLKAIEEIAFGDKIMTWNFFKGCYEEQYLAFVIDHGENSYETTMLEFSDGTSLSIIDEHGLFDYGLNKFVYLSSDNYSDYIGHEFVKNGHETNSLVKLINGSVKTEVTHAYSITSAYNYNSVANGLLTAPPPGEFYNWITMGEKMMYDSKKFHEDIETYGLYQYSQFEPYGISYETFEAFNGKYLRIPVEKGMFTFEYIIDLFNLYIDGF